MIRESKMVVKIALGVMLAVLSTLEKGVDYTFVEHPYQKYVKEFVKELEDAGIKIPEQKRWTVRTEPSFFVTTTIGQAIGMFDNIIAIFYYDWTNNSLYNFVNWFRQFDKTTLYVMGYWNPENAVMPNMGISTNDNLYGGIGIQVMYVFNH